MFKKVYIPIVAVAMILATSANAHYSESINDFSDTGFDNNASMIVINSLSEKTSFNMVCEDNELVQYINMTYIGGRTGSAQPIKIKVDGNPVVTETMIVSPSGKSVTFPDDTKMIELISSIDKTISVQTKLSKSRISSAKFNVSQWHKDIFKRVYDNCN